MKQRKSPGEVGEGEYKGHKDVFGDDGYVHHLNCVMVSQVDTYIKSYQTVHFIYVQFILSQLYLNKAVTMLKRQNKKKTLVPGQVAQLVGMSSPHTRLWI